MGKFASMGRNSRIFNSFRNKKLLKIPPFHGSFPLPFPPLPRIPSGKLYKRIFISISE